MTTDINSNRFKNKYNKIKYKFDNGLSQFFERQFFNQYNKTNIFSRQLYDVISYSLFSDAKRIRPIIMLEVASYYDVDDIKALPFAYALEMIHTYSLIHDDLPAMDDDCMRRGQPTNHIKFTEADAILAGDALLNFAYKNLFHTIMTFHYDQSMVRASYEIASKAGVEGMIVGQMADIHCEKEHFINADVSTLDFIHKNKTAALLEASFLCGAYLGNASKKELSILRNIALKIGHAFQIRDDILDVEGDADKLGKSIGKDDKNNKLTYPTLIGMDASKNMVHTLSNDAKDLLSTLDYDTWFIRAMIDDLICRDR